MAAVKKRSRIWDYFMIDQEEEKLAVCNECKERVSRGGASVKNYNTTNLRNHLRRFHQKLFDELLTKESDDAEKKEEENESQGKKRRKQGEARQLTLTALKQQKEPWNYDNPEHKRVTERIAEMIALDSQPFSIVEDTGFLRLLAHVSPRYITPSRKYFSDKIIPEMYVTLKEKIFQDLHSDGEFPISFTSDIWSRDGGESFISWTAHYISSEFVREERILQVCPFPGSHTADAIAEMISKLLEAWNIDKRRVHTVVRDNAANMVAGIRQCGLSGVSCVIHTLQLVIKDSILVQKSVTDMLVRCRKIVGHFKHSSLATSHLRSIQKQLSLVEHKLMQDEPTRWDSSYYMLERLVEQRRAISLYDADYGLPEQLSASDWQQAEKILKLLEPFQRVTKELSAKDASVSQVIPFIETLKIELSSSKDSDLGIKTTKQEMLKSLKARFGYIHGDDNYVIATLLDPRFKATFFDEETVESFTQTLLTICEAAAERLQETADKQRMELQPMDVDDSVEGQKDNSDGSKAGFSVWESCKNAMKKLGNSSTAAASQNPVERMISDYLDEPPMEGPKLKFVKPLEYWKSHNQRFFVLAKMARKYLSSPASSVASESLFSETGIIDSNRRRRLLAEKIEMLTFIKRNLVIK